MTMNRDTQRLLRILAVIVFVVGVVLVLWDSSLDPDTVRWGSVLLGNALFALSFATT